MFNWKTGCLIFFVFYALGLGWSAYFGWNWRPCCQTERVGDIIDLMGISVGAGIFLGTYNWKSK